jgi:hypothetical protein
MLTARHVEQHFEPTHGDSSLSSLNSQPIRTYPTINRAAFYGLPGDIVEAIEPLSKADLIAILVNTLTAFGNVVGKACDNLTFLDAGLTFSLKN